MSLPGLVHEEGVGVLLGDGCVQIAPHFDQLVYAVVLRQATQNAFDSLEHGKLLPQRAIDEEETALQEGLLWQLPQQLLSAVNTLEEHRAVELVGVFEGEVAAFGGGPAASGLFLDHLQEILTSLLFVGVLAFPK